MRIGFLIAIPLSLSACGPAAGQEKPATAVKPNASTFGYWMDIKLEESQSLLASLARADYAATEASAEKLKATSSLQGFVRRGTKG